MLEWVVNAGTMAAMNFVEGNVVLGYMHFITPVRLGDVLVFRSWVVGVRRSSVSVLVESYVKRGRSQTGYHRQNDFRQGWAGGQT
jgi:acyl-CoA hydrolase